MADKGFALFIDVMGIQQKLMHGASRKDNEHLFKQCREHLEAFHRDLTNVLESLEMLLIPASIPPPFFVAEFSDSAYVVSSKFGSVAIAGTLLMRRALRHQYPLRGGIGVGSFFHEASGVRTMTDKQTWSTSSFLGSAIVTAYQAERSTIPGLRIFIHPQVLRRNTESLIKVYPQPLLKNEVTETASHELRFWNASESAYAKERLRIFRDKQILSERAKRHYDAAIESYDRFSRILKPLPYVPPAIWL